MMKRLSLAAMALMASVVAAKEGPVGRKVENFTLQDYRGAARSLADFDQKVVVIAFLGTECPLAKQYGPRLEALSQKYQAKGVAFVGVNSNAQDSIAEIGAFVRDAGIKFPVLKDPGAAVADKLGAVRTPEVFALDKDRIVRYCGRIDDRFGIGYIKDKRTHDYLEAALDQMLAGETVATAMIESVGCYIGRPKKASADAEVTFSEHIAKIFQDRCVECHRQGEIGPFALTDYSEVVGWVDTIAEVVKDRRMPPWHANPAYGHFKNDRSLPEDEKAQILKWIAAGAPEGDRSKLPKPREFVSGWSLPRDPDLVLDVQKKPYMVPADGVVAYQMFVVDPGFTEDKWVTASQIIPGAAPVVHHVLCFVAPPNSRGRRFDENGLGFLSAYVPGYRPTPLRAGMAKHVPAGSKLIFQMHYTPIGKEQADLSKIGFVFAKPDEITHLVQTVSAANPGLNIPPHASDYKREATMMAYKHDLLVLGYSPHMHVRGKSFTYEAIFPDGKRETLLDVPRYDFNWQTNYEPAEIKTLPPGTRIHCVAHWDNSENNLANPDPTAKVHWGDQTWDEMMIGFFDVAIPVDREKLLKNGEIPRLESAGGMEERARLLVAGMDENGDGKISREELPERFGLFLGFIDKNKDGAVDADEAIDFFKNGPGSAFIRGRGRGGEGVGPGRFGGDRPDGEPGPDQPRRRNRGEGRNRPGRSSELPKT